MTRRFGIDTSVLVRLLTGVPQTNFDYCVSRLSALVDEGEALFASNQVIGEACVAVQHHYGVSKADAARASLVDVLRSGLAAPLNGTSVIAALEAQGGPGLFDRLISDDYSREGLQVPTLDRKMASLAEVRRL